MSTLNIHKWTPPMLPMIQHCLQICNQRNAYLTWAKMASSLTAGFLLKQTDWTNRMLAPDSLSHAKRDGVYHRGAITGPLMLRLGISRRHKSSGCPLASAAPVESQAFPLSEQSTWADLRAGGSTPLSRLHPGEVHLDWVSDCSQVRRRAKGTLVGKP